MTEAASSEASGPNTGRAVSAIRLLQGRARASNLVRLTQLRGWLDRLDAGPLSDQDRFAARDLAHKIVGSAGTFGYPEVSAVAGRLETFFSRGRFTPGTCAEAREWLRAMETTLQSEAVDADWD